MNESASRRTIQYLNWIFNPFHGLDTSQVYDLLSTTSTTRNGLYLNLGYWPEAATTDEASDALAMLVAEAGGMGPGDRVLDCGFGFGDQDALWARRCQPEQIIGLNITASQVAVARERIAREGLSEMIDLREGSATAMPIANGSMDLVLSLESAFHYSTRVDFFREAYRVLKPGGRLVTADILPLPRLGGVGQRLRQRLSWWLVASKFVIPRANVYTADAYGEKLVGTGFEGIRVASIRDEVYGPLHRYLQAHREHLEQLHPVARIPARAALRRPAEHVYAGLDYILAVARKPT